MQRVDEDDDGDVYLAACELARMIGIDLEGADSVGRPFERQSRRKTRRRAAHRISDIWPIG